MHYKLRYLRGEKIATHKSEKQQGPNAVESHDVCGSHCPAELQCNCPDYSNDSGIDSRKEQHEMDTKIFI